MAITIRDKTVEADLRELGSATGEDPSATIARLNLADCLSYAAAKRLNSLLLYKGDGFAHTEIESALPA